MLTYSVQWMLSYDTLIINNLIKKQCNLIIQSTNKQFKVNNYFKRFMEKNKNFWKWVSLNFGKIRFYGARFNLIDIFDAAPAGASGHKLILYEIHYWLQCEQSKNF